MTYHYKMVVEDKEKVAQEPFKKTGRWDSDKKESEQKTDDQRPVIPAYLSLNFTVSDEFEQKDHTFEQIIPLYLFDADYHKKQQALARQQTQNEQPKPQRKTTQIPALGQMKNPHTKRHSFTAHFSTGV